MKTLDYPNKRIILSIYKTDNCPYGGGDKCISNCEIQFWCKLASGTEITSTEFQLLKAKVKLMIEYYFTEEELFEELL